MNTMKKTSLALMAAVTLTVPLTGCVNKDYESRADNRAVSTTATMATSEKGSDDINQKGNVSLDVLMNKVTENMNKKETFHFKNTTETFVNGNKRTIVKEGEWKKSSNSKDIYGDKFYTVSSNGKSYHIVSSGRNVWTDFDNGKWQKNAPMEYDLAMTHVDVFSFMAMMRSDIKSTVYEGKDNVGKKYVIKAQTVMADTGASTASPTNSPAKIATNTFTIHVTDDYEIIDIQTENDFSQSKNFIVETNYNKPVNVKIPDSTAIATVVPSL